MLSMSIVRIMVVALATMAAAVPDQYLGPNGMEFSSSQPEYYRPLGHPDPGPAFFSKDPLDQLSTRARR